MWLLLPSSRKSSFVAENHIFEVENCILRQFLLHLAVPSSEDLRGWKFGYILPIGVRLWAFHALLLGSKNFWFGSGYYIVLESPSLNKNLQFLFTKWFTFYNLGLLILHTHCLRSEKKSILILSENKLGGPTN